LCDRQFRFRRSLSTVDAVLAVKSHVAVLVAQDNIVIALAIDISNAFNSLEWDSIHRALGYKGVPSYLRRVLASYLDDRWLQYWDFNGRLVRRRVTCDVSGLCPWTGPVEHCI
jgi:hypothetical protein